MKQSASLWQSSLRSVEICISSLVQESSPWHARAVPTVGLVNFLGSIIFVSAVVHLSQVYYSFNLTAVSYQHKSAYFLISMRKYIYLIKFQSTVSYCTCSDKR